MSNDQNIPNLSQDQESLSTTMHEPPAENDEQGLTRHSVYYFDPVVFRVEGVLFKVPKYGFMVPGTMFYDMFSLPVPEGEEAQGSSDANPIELPSGITQQEFFGFLFLLYPFLGHEADPEINYEELVGALKLGTMWEFTKIRNLAIHLLSPMLTMRHPAETVLLAKKYRLKRVLRQGYTTLINRYNTIQSLRVPHQLDWETISGIFAARAHSLEGTTSDTIPGSVKTVQAHSDLDISPEISLEEYIDIVFGEEFKYMENESEIDFQGLDKRLQDRLTNSESSKKVTSEGSRVSPQAFQEGHVSTTTKAIDRPHHIYYIDIILIRVGSTLFSLPKTELLACLTVKEKSVNSIRDLGPEITEDHFYSFLTILYPIDNVPLNHTYEKWLGVLSLSTLWGKEEIRQRAIVELTPLMTGRNQVETLLIARRYHVKHWLLLALEELVVQSPPLMIQSLREQPFELDWETIAKLLSIRDQSITCRQSTKSSKTHLVSWEKLFNNVDPSTVRVLIERDFAEETMYW